MFHVLCYGFVRHRDRWEDHEKVQYVEPFLDDAECTKLIASGLCTIPVAWAVYALILGFIDAQT